MFYKLSIKNLTVDVLILSLCAFSIFNARVVANSSVVGNIGLEEVFWITIAAGVFLARWAYLGWSYFYGENARKSSSPIFKIHRAWVTFGAVVTFIVYFVIVFYLLSIIRLGPP